MIRPFTIVTFMMASASGLYLYQSKHEVQVLDKSIEHTVRDTSLLREQSRLLAAEWTMLNDPEQLRRFSDMYLSIKPILPTQFTSLADLDSHLPPITTQPPAANTPSPTDIKSGAVPAEAAPPVVANAIVPPPPPAVVTRMPEHKIVATRPTGMDTVLTHSVTVTDVRPADQHVSGQRTADQRTADQRTAEQRPIDIRPVELRPADQHTADKHLSEQRMFEQRSAELHIPHTPDARTPETRVADARVNDSRPAQIRPPPLPVRTAAALPQPLPSIPSKTAPPSQPVPYTGSLLGMAHGAVPSPVPRPTPVNATNWYNAN